MLRNCAETLRDCAEMGGLAGNDVRERKSTRKPPRNAGERHKIARTSAAMLRDWKERTQWRQGISTNYGETIREGRQCRETAEVAQKRQEVH